MEIGDEDPGDPPDQNYSNDYFEYDSEDWKKMAQKYFSQFWNYISCFKFPPHFPFSTPIIYNFVNQSWISVRRGAAGRDWLNQSRSHKRNFLKL